MLFSSSADDTIRIWSIENFSEMYRFNVLEPILNFKLLRNDSVLYTTTNEVTVSKLRMFYRLFSKIGAQARWVSSASSTGLPSRIIYVGKDGAVRLISHVHGNTISIAFPSIKHNLVDVVHDPRCNANYACLDNGSVMVFSTKTNPCR